MPADRAATILVVDDNEANRYALNRNLQRAGFRVIEASRGEEALQLARQNPDLIILDIRLPDLLGYEVCRILKADSRTASIPILNISATFRMSSDKVLGLESGADGFLTGPVEPEELLANVRLLLRLRETTDSLRRTNERLNAVLSTITDVYFSVDFQWRFIEMNPAAERIFGRPARELIGKSYTGEFPQTAGSDFLRVYEKARTEARPVHFEGRSAINGGWFEVHAYPRDDRLEVYAREITERKRAEEALERANEELERKVRERTARLEEVVSELEHFSYTITHDMRAPLRAMQGFGAMLLDSCHSCPHPERPELVTRIIRSSERMDKLITDALSYGKVIREELPLEPISVELLLRGILESYPDFQPPKAEIQIAGSIPPVMGNEAALTQCFSNLLGNAVKFVEPGRIPRVTVRAEKLDDRVRIWVEDNGIGIPKEYQDQMFGMFQKLNNNREGTGIGLALVSKVVSRMGGKLGVESELGQGSRFWIEVKAADSELGVKGGGE
jgi:PAS domain S-box-containing protein